MCLTCRRSQKGLVEETLLVQALRVQAGQNPQGLCPHQ